MSGSTTAGENDFFHGTTPFKRDEIDRSISCLILAQRPCELIGTGSTASAAVNTGQLCDGIINLHAFNETSNTLSITHAATDETAGSDHIIFNLKLNRSGTGTFCLEFNHFINPP
jgi:hypothetical protein